VTVSPIKSKTPSGTVVILGVLFAFPLLMIILWAFYVKIERQIRSNWIFAAPAYVAPLHCSWRINQVSPACNTSNYYLGVGDAGRFGLNTIRWDPGIWLRIDKDAVKIVCVNNSFCLIQDRSYGKFSPPTPEEINVIKRQCTAHPLAVIKINARRYADCKMFTTQ